MIECLPVYLPTHLSVSRSASQLMGWLRLVGSWKLWVSFAEYSLFYGALLQKSPIILMSLLIVATPQSVYLPTMCRFVCPAVLSSFNLFFCLRVLVGLSMRWLRWVGSLKWQVSFAKEPYKRDDILQKRPMIVRSLIIVATPYLSVCHSVSQ